MINLRNTDSRAFTLIEILLMTFIVAALLSIIIISVKPGPLNEKSRTAVAKESLIEIAKAAGTFAAINEYYPDDENRNIPSAIMEYLQPGTFPYGPFPGSVYDWDNWENQTCWDGSTGILQVTLRQINDYQSKSDYTMYYVIKGVGIPHCFNSSTKGVCINCESRYP